MEENIKRKIVGVGDKSQIKLTSVPAFARCYADVNIEKTEDTCDESGEEIIVKSEVKDEDMDINDLELNIKKENIEVKLEASDCESGRVVMSTAKSTVLNSQMIMYNCEICDYKTKYKGVIDVHMLTHEKPLVLNYNCLICSYQTKNKKLLNYHMNIHNKVQMYKCGVCQFVTLKKERLVMHMLRHRENNTESKLYVFNCADQSIMYQCENCKYKTKCKRSFDNHSLLHKKPKKPDIYQCDVCKYSTKNKPITHQHKLIHKRSTKPITKHKCDICAFVTNDITAIKRHVVIHGACENSSFQRKYKSYLKPRYSLSDIKMDQFKLYPRPSVSDV